MKINPLDDRVLVKPAEAKEKTESGLYLPDSARDKPLRGKVLATGPGKIDDNGKRTPVPVKKGDEVLFGSYAGTEIEMDGQEYKIMRAGELLGVIEK
jgi:chaperonin GroES